VSVSGPSGGLDPDPQACPEGVASPDVSPHHFRAQRQRLAEIQAFTRV
jgi:hypothetical protein